MTSVLVLGFLIGLRHALEADHLAAVATIATRTRSLKKAWRIGALWGLGHSLTLLVVGGVLLMTGDWISEETATVLEMVVGAMLILLGLDVLRRLWRERVHFHRHSHGPMEHFHAHSHAGESDHARSAHHHSHDHRMGWRALLVGLVHGVAGSAALILLAASQLDSAWVGLAYIGLFGLGSIAGMALMSCAIALPLRWAATHLTWAYNGLTATVGLLTIALGSHVLWQGFVA